MTKLYPLRWLFTLLLFFSAVPLLLAATITVTSTADDGTGTLRQAVRDAVAGDVIRFAPSTNGTPIVLEDDRIVVNKSIQIIGNGMDQTILSGGSEVRIFSIDGSSTVQISKLTIRDGFAAIGGGVRVRANSTLRMESVIIRECAASGASATQGGGGIYNQGSVFLTRVMITDNTALGTNGSGGGILNGPGGFIQVALSFITNNQANRAGGGIEDASGGMDESVVGSSFITNNTALGTPGNGGAIHVGGIGNLRIAACTITGNVAASEGGGVWMGTGQLDVRQTTIDDNEAQGDDADEGGGGLYNDGGTMLVNPDTRVTNNRATGASGSGGGILNNFAVVSGTEGPDTIRGFLRLNDATVASNTAMRAGGGIEHAAGAGDGSIPLLLVYNSRVDSNVVMTSPGNGGGIHVGGNGMSNITRSSVSNNSAGAEGGGLWNGVGRMVVRNTVVDSNVALGDDASQGGGGLYNNGGTLIVNPGTRVTNNEASGTSGSGGGILNALATIGEEDFAGTLRVNDATIANNTAMRAGGGIEDASGAASAFFVYNARVDSNTVMTNPGNGGGIHIGGDGNSNITLGSVSGNTAGAEGGGLWNGIGTMTVRRVVIDGNVASGDDATQGGGGLYNDGGSLVINPNTRVSNNEATGTSGSGGGVLIASTTVDGVDFAGTLFVNDAVIVSNSAVRAGGGIEHASGEDGFFRIQNAVIDSNSVSANPGNGGGIHVGGTGNLAVRTSLVRANTASSEGGGIWGGLGTITINGGTIANNIASGTTSSEGGGGLYTDGGTLTVSGATLTGNLATSDVEGAAGSGGAILIATGGSLTLNNSTLTGNMANRAGGGIEDASGATGTTVITGSTIDGNTAMSAPGNGGGIHVGTDGDLSITGGTVSGNVAATEGGGLWNGTGTMTITGVTIDGNEASGDGAPGSIEGGGGIYNDGGSLELTSSTTLTNNSATGAAGSGGAILSAGDPDVLSTRSVVMNGGTIAANSAMRAGGGVEIVLGDFTSTDVTFDGNTAGAAPGNGGALHVTGTESNIDINGGSVINNTAANEGGGLWNMMGSTMEVTNVSIMDNTVFAATLGEDQLLAGGGVYNNGGDLNLNSSTVANNTVTTGDGTELAGAGGGIANAGTSGDFSSTTSTIAGNSALSGGGIANVSTAIITNTTITENTATIGGGVSQAVNPGGGASTAIFTIQGSILSGNSATTDPNISREDGTTASAGFNFFGTVENDDIVPNTGNGDIVGTDADLGMLMDNGGMTMTLKPNCGSPVIGAGNPGDNTPDQLGQSINGVRDIGSFEVQEACGSVVGQQQDTKSNSMAADSDQVEVYPNPVRGDRMNVTLPTRFEGDVTLRIMDASGRVRQMSTRQGGGTYQLQLSDYQNGSYILQAVSGEQVENVRFVVSK